MDARTPRVARADRVDTRAVGYPSCCVSPRRGELTGACPASDPTIAISHDHARQGGVQTWRVDDYSSPGWGSGHCPAAELLGCELQLVVPAEVAVEDLVDLVLRQQDGT